MFIQIIPSSKTLGAKLAVVSVGSREVYILNVFVYSPALLKLFSADSTTEFRTVSSVDIAREIRSRIVT